MPISSDFTINFTRKTIKHTSGTTVYSANALYSYVQDTLDELANLDDDVPMSAQTPTEYTMINGWFIDDDSTTFLDSGAIKTSGYNNAVRQLNFGATYTNAVAGDIGKSVLGAATGDTGSLMAYNNTSKKWYLRPDDPTFPGGDEFDTIEGISITGGTGAGSTAGSSKTGEELYANIFTIGTIESTPSPQIYVFQNGTSIAEWSANTNWDRGHIDVLIKVKEVGSEIDGANITVFARQYGDTYDHFPIDLTSGGRNAVPLATANDLNNTTGEFFLLYDGQSTSFVANEVINGQTTGATAYVLSDKDDGATGVLRLNNVNGGFQDNENLRSGVTVRAVCNGSLGDTLIGYDNENTGFTTLGQVVTGSAAATLNPHAKRQLVGIQDSGTTGSLNLLTNVSYESNGSYYVAYSDNWHLQGATNGSALADGVSTTLVSAFDNISIWFVNGSIHYTTQVVNFNVGRTVTQHGGSTYGVIIADQDDGTSGSLLLANFVGSFNGTGSLLDTAGGSAGITGGGIHFQNQINEAFQAQSAFPYNVIIDCGSRTLAQVYEYVKHVNGENNTSVPMYTAEGGSWTVLDGEEYITAISTYSPVKASPFGTFAGGKFFGARGIWLQNMAAADAQNFQLIDATGSTQTPPNFQSVTVTSLVSGDRVAVFRTVASGSIDKALYTITNSHAAGLGSILVNTNIATDTPTSGSVRVVENGVGSEDKYLYTSYTGSKFVLSGITGSAYDTNDTVYVGYLDRQATSATESVTIIYTADRTVKVRVRLKGILPFETAGTVSSTGLSVAAIRTTDTIVT